MLGRSTTRHSRRPVLETFEERVLFKKKGKKKKKKGKKENKITVDLYFALRDFVQLRLSVLGEKKMARQ